MRGIRIGKERKGRVRKRKSLRGEIERNGVEGEDEEGDLINSIGINVQLLANQQFSLGLLGGETLNETTDFKKTKT